MKIGIFDSGLGGLIITKAILKKLPWFNYAYLGDTKYMPYGSKTAEQIRLRTKKAVEFLFKQNCELIIIACNTASAWALRYVQKKVLPSKYPEKRVLGVIVPTLEAAGQKNGRKTLGILATESTVKSKKYIKELKKLFPGRKIIQKSAPELASLIENNALLKAEKQLKYYLNTLLKKDVEEIVLACTHYSLLKQWVKKYVGPNIAIISQDDLIPKKLEDYLNKHKSLKKKLGRGSGREFFVTKPGADFEAAAKNLFGKKINFSTVNI